MPGRVRIGELLLQAGLIDRFQLDSAIGHQKRWGGRLGAALVKLGFVSEEALVRALSRQLGFPAANLEGKRIAPEVLELIPLELAEKYGCIPLFVKREGGRSVLHLGLCDPGDLAAIDDLSFRTGMRIQPVLVAMTQLHDALSRSYRDRRVTLSEDAGEFSHTVLEAGDTAPLLAGPREDPPPLELEQEAPAARPEPTPAPQPAPSARPREVKTRAILQALTQLLIEKGVVSRDELLARVRAVGADDKPKGP
jgi:hypothetical protein